MSSRVISLSVSHTIIIHTHKHKRAVARIHARTHTHTHARTHTLTHAHTHTHLLGHPQIGVAVKGTYVVLKCAASLQLLDTHVGACVPLRNIVVVQVVVAQAAVYDGPLLHQQSTHIKKT